MKKLLFYIIALLSVATALSGCKKDEGASEMPPPEISVKTPKTYSCEGKAYSIRYNIENPREGVKLEAATDTKWITELSTDEKSIMFTLAENTAEKDRSGKINLAYEGAEPVSVSIKQEGVKDGYKALDTNGKANCYIVSEAGAYKFAAVKGNGSEPAGEISSVEVLWESFGTATAPKTGDLIAEASFKDNVIRFKTASDFKSGNAVIAAKNVSGKILWSWHIWLTDIPEEQVYNNGAGIMMDRNLGAVSAVPGEVEAMGLIYQWGRKDPFMGLSSYSEKKLAESTLSPWPYSVERSASTGTIDYVVANPTVFIKNSSGGGDWLYTIDATAANRWLSKKTIYDPCPPGYRVPDGGTDGIWAKAFGVSSNFKESFDSKKKGFNFGSDGGCNNKLSGTAAVCWYPAAEYLFNGLPAYAGTNGLYWSWGYSQSEGKAYILKFYSIGPNNIMPVEKEFCVYGCSVRCQKE